MKKSQSIIGITTLILVALPLVPSGAKAQTILSGNYAIEGNLEVGHGVTQGNLIVNGSVELSGGLAGGDHSVAINDTSITGGLSSTAIAGGMTGGDYSVAIGYGTYAEALYCTVVGANNTFSLSASPSAWVDTDPIFVVGNGTDFFNLSDAFVVLKNGDVQIPKRQGDILMGEFGETEP